MYSITSCRTFADDIEIAHKITLDSKKQWKDSFTKINSDYSKFQSGYMNTQNQIQFDILSRQIYEMKINQTLSQLARLFYAKFLPQINLAYCDQRYKSWDEVCFSPVHENNIGKILMEIAQNTFGLSENEMGTIMDFPGHINRKLTPIGLVINFYYATIDGLTDHYIIPFTKVLNIIFPCDEEIEKFLEKNKDTLKKVYNVLKIIGILCKISKITCPTPLIIDDSIQLNWGNIVTQPDNSINCSINIEEEKIKLSTKSNFINYPLNFLGVFFIELTNAYSEL